MKLYDMLLSIMDRQKDQEERMGAIETHLAVYNEQLKQHIAGVELAREENKLLREYIDVETQKLSTRILPLEEHETVEKAKKEFRRSVLETSVKILTLLSLLAGLIAFLY